ncbi:hypothetical protein H5410_045337 [Solanum commersonii]|uniref:Uncharacterized protein n=1 Tax=Solanum commersonii TaxID=4109 RepID=A0A9J5XBA5_SOLCO|nr:hypothetical protein H5410_045337 [Solanum commersonii]
MALHERVRRLFMEPYHSWSEIPEGICHAIFNEFKTMYTWKRKYNIFIVITFERRASARLSSWLQKAQDLETSETWLLPNVFEALSRY